MLSYKMAFRNIWRQKRRSFLTMLIIASAYIIIGLVFSILEGSYSQIISLFTKAETGHLQIHSKKYAKKASIHASFPYNEQTLRAIHNYKDIITASPRVLGAALAYGDDGSLPVQIRGIQPELENKGTELSKKIKEGEFLPKKVYEQYPYPALIGYLVQKKLNAKVGDELVILSQARDGSVANDLIKVKGIVGDKESFESRNIYLHIKNAQQFFWLENQIHELMVLSKNYKEGRFLAEQISSDFRMQNFSVRPWQELQKEFYKTMQADKKGNNITIFIIVCMVFFSVLNTILMSVLERTREYGIMAALGTKPGAISKLVYTEIFILSCLSILLGVIISIPLQTWFMQTGFMLPEPMEIGGMRMQHIRGELSSFTLLIPIFIILITSFVASLYPAWKAKNISPIDALRTY